MTTEAFKTAEAYSGVEQSDPDTGAGALPESERHLVPFAMEDSDWVPKERYYDRGFYELEKEHMWTKVWQMAARLEEIPHPSDYVEYEIAGNSILIVRQNDGGVRALHNVCRHRATELAKGCGRLPGGQLVCPFHGWRWNLDGSPSYVYMEESFNPSTLQKKDLALQEAKVEIWAGMVWINMDHDAKPLAEYLGAVKTRLEDQGIANMRVKWWKQVVVNANWKMAEEAFFEAYHVWQTHPQLLLGGGQAAGEHMAKMVEYTAWEGGHGRFQSSYNENSEYLETTPESLGEELEGFIAFARTLADGQDAMTLQREIQIFESVRNRLTTEGGPAGAQAIQALYEYAAQAGIPLPTPSPEVMRMWGGDIMLFPNFLMLPQYGNCLSYRSRPHEDDPEKTIFDVWSLITYPEGSEPERAELMGVFDKDDVEHWGLIPRQDFSNIERQQRGLHNHSYKASRLSTVHEKTIANMHQEIDRYIARGVAGK